MSAKYFFGFILSFIVGIILEEVFGLGDSFAVLCVVVATVILLRQRVRSGVAYSLFVSLLLLGCALGVLRVDVSHMKQNTHVLDRAAGKTIQAKGIVVNEPDVRESYTNIVLEIQSVSQGQKQNVLEGMPRVLARVPTYPTFRYGDEVAVTGRVSVPKNFPSKDGQRSFDYRAYLAKDGISYEMHFPKIEVVGYDKGNIVLEKLFALKAVLMKNISRMIREPEAALGAGILLGAKESLGSDLLQKFRETGVAHIVVLSGYNIAVVAGVISRLVVFMPFAMRLIASGFGIVFFALMVGGGATVVRATVMALIVILARALGREGDALRVLVLAGGLMVFANPMILLHDVSFQLSFMATLAIVVFVPLIEKYFLWVSSRVLREIIITTIATQVFVFPLILYYMGSVSLIGFVANIFILPVVPIAMLAVALVIAFAWVPFVGSALALVASAVLAYMILAVEFFARVPFASLSGISFPLWMLMLVYSLLGYVVIKKISRVPAENKKSDYEF